MIKHKILMLTALVLCVSCTKNETPQALKTKIENKLVPQCMQGIDVVKKVKKVSITNLQKTNLCTCSADYVFEHNKLENIKKYIYETDKSPQGDKMVKDSLAHCIKKLDLAMLAKHLH